MFCYSFRAQIARVLVNSTMINIFAMSILLRVRSVLQRGMISILFPIEEGSLA